jgi:LETM1-like, RBD
MMMTAAVTTMMRKRMLSTSTSNANIVKATLDFSKSFWSGSKAVVNNYRQRSALLSGPLQSAGLAENDAWRGNIDVTEHLSRSEYRIVLNAGDDLRRVLPYLIGFWVPFLGYAVPFYLLSRPQVLPPCFWTDSLHLKMSEQKSEALSASLKRYFDNESDEATYDQVYAGVDDMVGIARRYDDVDDVLKRIAALSGDGKALHWDVLDSSQAKRIVDALGVDEARAHADHLLVDDAFLRRDAANLAGALTRQELLDACLERGIASIDPATSTADELAAALNDWLEHSALINDDRSTSTSYLAHMIPFHHRNRVHEST